MNLWSNYQYINHSSSEVLGIRNTSDFNVFSFEHLHMYNMSCGQDLNINMKWIIFHVYLINRAWR